ncbi:DoxX family protein [Actinoplanes sp. NPDC051494]|uniref:DoxX family protein n=1 Tax=Actinoplanes sp. NPDC051494 TaxID=3363907 RepID=UPI0037B1FB4D
MTFLEKSRTLLASIEIDAGGDLPRSSTPGERAIVFAAYVTLNIAAALFSGFAAVTYLINHSYPRAQMEIKRLPMSWMPRLGGALAAGAVGLLVGFAVHIVGTLAALGLVLYFIGAFIAHMRVGSRNLVGWAIFFATTVATLWVNLAHHGIS